MGNNIVSIVEFKQRADDTKTINNMVGHLNELYKVRQNKIMALSSERFISPLMDVLKSYILALSERAKSKKDILDAIDFRSDVKYDTPYGVVSEPRTTDTAFSNYVPVYASFDLADSLAFPSPELAHLVKEDHAMFAEIGMSYCHPGHILQSEYGTAMKFEIDDLCKRATNNISPMDSDSSALVIFIEELLRAIDDEQYIFFKLIGDKFPFRKMERDQDNTSDLTFYATRADVVLRIRVFAKRYFKHINTLNNATQRGLS